MEHNRVVEAPTGGEKVEATEEQAAQLLDIANRRDVEGLIALTDPNPNVKWAAVTFQFPDELHRWVWDTMF
jgi:hypothetical protein